eukprot:159379-Pleurochrysis_carterae.AAC.3
MTRLGEALCITASWCPAAFSQVKVRLVGLITWKQHLKGNELASSLTSNYHNHAKGRHAPKALRQPRV